MWKPFVLLPICIKLTDDEDKGPWTLGRVVSLSKAQGSHNGITGKWDLAVRD